MDVRSKNQSIVALFKERHYPIRSRSIRIHFISKWEVSKLTYFTKNSSLSSQIDHQI